MLWQRFLGSIFCLNCKRGEYQNILKIYQDKQSLAISEIARVRFARRSLHSSAQR
jgi:hypothetical protein